MACDTRERPDGMESITDGIRDQVSLKHMGKPSTNAQGTGQKSREVQVQGGDNNHDTSEAEPGLSMPYQETDVELDVELGRQQFEEDSKRKTDFMNEIISMLPSYKNNSKSHDRPGSPGMKTAEKEDSGHSANAATNQTLSGSQERRVPQEQSEPGSPSHPTSEDKEKPSLGKPLAAPIEETVTSTSQIVPSGIMNQNMLQTPSEKELGNLEEKASGALVKYTITNNVLFMDLLCRRLDRDSRIIKCWRHLAYVLGVPTEVSRKCDFYTHRSPTEDLFEYLETLKPKLTVQQLKDLLKTIYRNDLVAMLAKYPGEQAVCDFITQYPEVLASLASEMDMESRTVGNWKSLAAKCGVTKNKVDQLGMPKHGPTDHLFYYIGKVEKHDTLTVAELKCHLKEMQRNDVLLLFEKHNDSCLVKDILGQDSELLGEVGHKLDKDVRALKGWRNLAYRLGIPSETYNSFDVSKEKKSPTRLLFEWLGKWQASLTIDKLLEAVKKIERNDVVELIRKESEAAIKRESVMTDHRTTSQVCETLMQMKKETSGKSLDDLSDSLGKNARQKGFQLRRNNSGNGNCMFDALSDQVQRIHGDHIEPQRMREILVQYLEDNPTLNGTKLVTFAVGYEKWSDYLKDMWKDGTWGDHIVLLAAANHFKRPIKIITSLAHNNDLVIMPVQASDQHIVNNPLVLGHIVEFHYVSLEPLSIARENGQGNPAYSFTYRPGSPSVGAQTTLPGVHLPKMTEAQTLTSREVMLEVHPTRLPYRIYGKLCRIMDTTRDFFDDFRMLAEYLGMDRDDIRWLEQQKDPTNKILHAMKSKLTVGELIQALREIEREDVASMLEKWVES